MILAMMKKDTRMNLVKIVILYVVVKLIYTFNNTLFSSV